MQETKTKKKSYTTGDLGINRGFKVSLQTLNISKPEIIQVTITSYTVPNINADIEDYELSINNIRKRYNKICSNFVRNNSNVLSNKYINDFNFSSTNLKKDYNKFITLSLYVKQKNNFKFSRIKNILKDSLKYSIKELSDKIREENFSCYKTKHKKVNLKQL